MAPYHLLVTAAVVAVTALRSAATSSEVECYGTSECRDAEYVECTSKRWYCPWSSSDLEYGDLTDCPYGVHGCVQESCGTAPISDTCVPIPSCHAGYTYNASSKQCEDIDECATRTHTCRDSQKCANVIGGFRCECPSGFRVTSSGCEDINECERSFGMVCCLDSDCINTHGSFECRCKTGFVKGHNSRTCIDINECATNTHNCQGNQTCVNKHGSYDCECPLGYRQNSFKECVDIDECASSETPVCRGESECFNTPGSYLCRCKPGFKRGYDAHSCIDRNECEENSHDCEVTCVNLWGSFRCDCHSGFRLAQDGRSCIDVNECQENSHDCEHTCVNMWGSFRCTCRSGFRLAEDGRSCVEIKKCNITGGSGAGCNTTCIPNPGSCPCPHGYIRRSGRRCREINVCEQRDVCRGEDEVCVNVRESYRCNVVHCPPGFARDPNRKARCKRENVDRECCVDPIACREHPLSVTYSYVTLPPNMKIPSSGRKSVFHMRGPRSGYSSVDFNLELVNATTPSRDRKVELATRGHFFLERTNSNEARVFLMQPLQGPQDVELDLNTTVFHNGRCSGTTVSKISILVSGKEL